jgi:DNA primase
MTLPPAFLDELRARVPVSEVVGRHVKLTRAGREHKGLCPFHSEKTPSFTVNDDKGFYHCFGCGAHGDVISFLRQHDKLEFMEAVEQLASMAGMEVPKPSPQARAQAEQQKGLAELAEQACRFFELELASEPGAEARAYLHRRGLDDATIRRFRLGFAPADSHGLVNHLTRKGYALDQILALGLARQPEDGRAPYAFFRNRVIFPVEDRRGRVVAFGGRLLSGDGPKYVNSPDSPLFHKGQLLYGLARARQAAGQGHSVVVVEGYMDVIALVRHGFEGAVAPLGTALTEAQIPLLWQIASVPVLCFDGDEAGRRAAARAVDRILPQLKPDKSARLAFLPEGEDPDSLLATQGRQTMIAVLKQAHSLAEQVWQLELSRHQLDTPEGRAGLKSALLRQAERIGDADIRRFYAREFADRVAAAFAPDQRGSAAPGGWSRRPGGGGGGWTGGRGGTWAPGPKPRARPAAGVEVILLAALVVDPSLIDLLDEPLAEARFTDSQLAALRDAALDHLAASESLDSVSLCDHLRQSGFDGALERLRAPALWGRAPFLDPRMGEEVRRASVQELLDRGQLRPLQAEVQAAAEAYMREPTDANRDRWRALQEAAQRARASGLETG